MALLVVGLDCTVDDVVRTDLDAAGQPVSTGDCAP